MRKIALNSGNSLIFRAILRFLLGAPMSEHETPNMQAPDAPDAIAERLNLAIKIAGGRDRVLKSGLVSRRTLQSAISGQRVKRSSLLSIASALHVPPSWLIEGIGEFNADWVSPKAVGQMTVKANDTVVGPLNMYPEPQPTSSDVPPTPTSELSPALFSIVDMDLLAGAIDAAREVLAARGAEPRGRSFAQIVCILYDEAAARLRGHDKR